MLTEEQQETLAQFRSIVSFAGGIDGQGGNSEIGYDAAVGILQNNDWNLEPALLQYAELSQQYYGSLNQASNQTAMSRNNSSNNSNSATTNLQPATGNASEEASVTGQPMGGIVSGIRNFVRGDGSRAGTNSNGYSQIPGSFPSDNNREPRPFDSPLMTLLVTVYRIVLLLVTVPLFLTYKLFGLAIVVLNKGFVGLGKLRSKFHFLRGKNSFSFLPFLSFAGDANARGPSPPLKSARKVHSVDTARKFIDDFNSDVDRIVQKRNSGSNEGANDVESSILYRNSNVEVPEFLEGGYSHALYLAKRDARWLVVYIQSDEHDDKERFIEKVLISLRFNKFLRENNVVIWGGNARESEAFQAANALHSTRLPFMALLCLTTQVTPTSDGNETSSPVLSVVSKIQGCHPLGKILVKFYQQIEKHEPGLVAIRNDLQQQQVARLLRERQDLAYQKSLLEDKMKRQQKMLRQRKREYKQNFMVLKTAEVKCTLDEGVVIRNEVEQQAKAEYARIAIRLPDGTRIVRYFHKTQCTVRDLYFYAELVRRGILHPTTLAVGADSLRAAAGASSTEKGQIEKAVSSAAREYLRNGRYEGLVEYDGSSRAYLFGFRLCNLYPRKELVVREAAGETAVGDVGFLSPAGNLVLEETGGDDGSSDGEDSQDDEFYADVPPGA